MEKYYDIIIIGGGISGLFCAYKLNRDTNANILIIEGKGRMGGRIKSVKRLNTILETGAARIGESHLNVFELCDELKISRNDFELLNEMDLTDVIEIFKNMNVNQKDTMSDLLNKTDMAKTDIEKIKNKWGYSGNIEILQSKLFKYDEYKEKHFKLKGGLSRIINELMKRIKNVHILTGYNCKKISLIDSKYLVDIDKLDNNIITSRHIILSTPTVKIEGLNDSLQKSIKSNNYIRLFGLNNKKSENQKIKKSSVNKIVCDNNIISYYYDGEKAYNLMNNYVNGNISYFKDKEWKESFYWKIGAWFWKKNVNAIKMSEYALEPIKNLHFVGDAFSLKQAWIDGALETSKKVLCLMGNVRYIKAKIMPRKTISKKLIKKIDENLNEYDVIYRGEIYNLKRFVNNHPGGEIIKIGLKTDITDLFDSIPHSGEARKILSRFKIKSFIKLNEY